jgi:hypothetical protein
MYTSLLTLVLSVVAVDPTWTDDYMQAQKRGAVENKPLAVFFGTGEQGQTQLVREGLSKEANDLLSTHFICVYIDTASPEGKGWAKAFDMKTGKGIVLSSRNAVYQVYSNEGVLANQDLVRVLQMHGPGSVGRTSYYDAQPPAPGAPAASGSYCPSCQGRGRR